MSISSRHHTPFDSESMPMLNDHVPLPGDPDLDSLSFEELGKLVAAHHSDEMSPEVCAQLDELLKESDELMRSVINEDALAGPDDAHVDGTNYDESPATQQGTGADSQDVQNPQMFEFVPSLKNFTAPVAGLLQLSHIDQRFHYPPQISAVPQAPPQGHPWSQHEYNPGYFMSRPPNTYTQPSAAPQGTVWSRHGYKPGYNANGPPGAYHPQFSAIVPAPPQGHALAHHRCHPAPSYPYQQHSTIAGPSNANYPIATSPKGQYAPLQTESSGSSNVAPTSFALDETASTSPRKRKTFLTSDGLSLSITPSMHKRRRPNTTDDYGPGKFGLYTLADASATIMTMPVHDPKPVDIRSRRTHDPNGNPLRTRRFGVMELDDTYPEESGNASDYSPQLTCVRSCAWIDQPCGLFIEVDKIRIDDHLWFWHGVEPTRTTPSSCRFKGCPDTETMKFLSRHIEGIHFSASYRCPYCKKLSSRTDSLTRHQKGCKPLLASRAHAEHGKYDFRLQEMVRSVSGYIVPAKNAT
ncbi:hypothetical protein C8R48DRAFT_417110 [Suillus tomentosus]|nr:hypothetical protein C8R48DRAFT_417110 [Suillus tomentosus]